MRFQEYEKDGKMYVDQDKVDEMVAEAYRQGVNYFDTAPKYCNCNSEEAVGRAVKGFRDKVLLSTKIPLDVCKKPGDYRRALEHSLDKLGTDHLDFYHFWGINRKEFDQTIMAQDLPVSYTHLYLCKYYFNSSSISTKQASARFSLTGWLK